MPREEFKDSLRQLLGVSELNIAELDTPPYTPDSPKSGIKQQIPSDHGQVSGAVVPDSSESQEMIDWTEKITCKHCNESIGGEKRLIEETPSRLGISELVKTFNENILFCISLEGKDPFLLITMLL